MLNKVKDKGQQTPKAEHILGQVTKGTLHMSSRRLRMLCMLQVAAGGNTKILAME